jgi:hypothetical protein
MWKRRIIPLLFCIAFVASTAYFWYLLKGFYDTPFIWTRFNNDFNFRMIPLGINLVVLIFFSSLLTLVKPRSHLVYGVYVVAAATFMFFIPVGVLHVTSAVLFALGFIFYEWGTNKLFHSYIKINFWDTYTKTIPTLITFLTVVIALGHFQASIDHIRELKITLPRVILEKAFESVTGSNENVQGTSTYMAQSNLDSAEVNELINQQLEQFGITDPVQQQLFREQVKQQLGIAPLTTSPEVASAAAGTTQQESLQQLTTDQPITTPGVSPSTNSFINSLGSLPGVDQVQTAYKDQLINQFKTQIENQINGLINKYSSYIPILNAIAIFFLLSILNLPVMLLSIALVVMTMDTLRFLKIIEVIKVKMDVERFAW